MGYFSDLKVTLVKQDYLKMLEKSRAMFNDINYLLDGDKYANVTDYKVNDIECVMIDNRSIKYYEEFKEIQEFEEFLKTAKHGYAFLRIGGRWDDVEYRNTAKVTELELPFKFIDIIEKKASNELLREIYPERFSEEYPITSKEYTISDRGAILEYCEENQEKQNYYKEMLDNNTQVKLILNVDVAKGKAEALLFCRKANMEKYDWIQTDTVLLDDAVWYLRFADREELLADMNKQKELENNEDENDEELE